MARALMSPSLGYFDLGSLTAHRVRAHRGINRCDERATRSGIDVSDTQKFFGHTSRSRPHDGMSHSDGIPGGSRALSRCLFVHQWAIHTESRRDVHGFHVKSVIPYRTCQRCGRMQRGIFDTLWRDIVWEPLRTGTDISPGRERFFRQPSSPLDQLAHSWGLRRSRSGDRTASGDARRSSWALASMWSSGLTIRCLFTHEWVRKQSGGGSFLSYRMCARCGTMQCGVGDGLFQDVAWETMRERAFVVSEQARVVRRPISRLDRIAHSLRLRRTRASDTRRLGNATH
jgi:hypothetical protein